MRPSPVLFAVLFALLAGLMPAVPVAAQAPEPEPEPQADAAAIDTENFRVPIAELATQESDPFRVGRVVNRKHPRWSDFGAAIERHPDTLSCLLPEARQGETADLLAFDWHGLWGPDVYVCLHRVFSSLGSIERAGDWMRHFGMRVGETSARDLSARIEGPDVWTIWGYWSLREAQAKSNLSGGLIGRVLNNVIGVKGYGVAVSFFQDSKVRNVTITGFSM